MERCRTYSREQKTVPDPKGFAHDFSVLSETAVFAYKCDEFYNPETEAGIAYDDPDLGIDWKIQEEDAILAEKDRLLPVSGSQCP